MSPPPTRYQVPAMFSLTLRSWFARRGSTIRRHPRPKAQPRLEALEDRLAPAHNITMDLSGSSTIPIGASTFSDMGDYVINPQAAMNASLSGITLFANNDITFNTSVAFQNAGVGLIAVAGRNLTLNNGVTISASNATLQFIANASAVN